MPLALLISGLVAGAGFITPSLGRADVPLSPAFWRALAPTALSEIFDGSVDLDQRPLVGRYAPLTPTQIRSAELLPLWDEIQTAYAALYPSLVPPLAQAPRLLLVDAPENVNAWNTVLPRCVRLPIRIVPALGLETDVATRVIAVDENARVSATLRTSCEESPIDATDARAFVASFNRSAPAGCAVAAGAAGEWTISRATCPDLASTAPDEAGALVFPSVTNWIAVYSGVVEKAEARFGHERARGVASFLLAHEYVHWARAHASHGKDFGFFYEVARYERGQGIVPITDDLELHALWNATVHPLAIAATAHAPDPKPTREWNRYLAPVIREELPRALLPRVCARGACATDCRAWALDATLTRASGCLSTIPYAAEGPLLARQLAARYGWSDFQPEALRPRSLLDLFRAASLRLDVVEFAATDFATRVRERRLGQYTIEEEADFVAYRIERKLGHGPEGALDFYTLYTEARRAGVGDALARFEWEWAPEQCQNQNLYPALAARELVPLGILEDAHHSPCYRASRLVRERSRGFWNPASAIP